MRKIKFFVILLSIIAVVSCAIALAGCSLFGTNDSTDNNNIDNNNTDEDNNADSATQTTDTFEFTANSVKAVNTSISGDIVIPSEFNGYTITEIPSYAFRGCSAITSIIVPDTVTSIGLAAFEGCMCLKSITLPFVGETRSSTWTEGTLGYIFGPGSSDYLGGKLVNQYYEANDSDYYKSWNIPIGLESVTITDATQLSVGAFSNMSMLKKINLNDGILAVGYRAFYGCSNIKTISLPSINGIPRSLFSGCTSLTEFTINEKVTEIDNWAFGGCTQLKRLNSSVDGCFVVPDTVQEFGTSVFNGCICIQELTLPFVGATQSSTGREGVLGYIFGTSEYLGGTEVEQYHSKGSFGLFNSWDYYMPTGLKSVTITNALQISIGAFSNMTMLTSLRVNSQAKNAVGDRAFYNCVEPTWY